MNATRECQTSVYFTIHLLSNGIFCKIIPLPTKLTQHVGSWRCCSITVGYPYTAPWSS